MRLRRSLPTGLAVLATLAAFVTLPTPAFADSTTDTYIVQLKSGVSADKVTGKLMGASARVIHKVFQGGIVKLTAAQAQALSTNPEVKSVHKDAVVTTAATETGAPWDLDILDSPTATLDQTYTSPNDGSGVTVYVLDSGILRTHNEFASATIATGRDFIPNDTTTGDCNGHGTAVSSLIAGATLGASKGVTLVPLKVLDCTGSGAESSIISAAEWIASNRTPGAAVANLSFGVSTNVLQGDTSLNAAFQSLIDSGITIVAAAGNDGVDACTETPASLPDAITVASVKNLVNNPPAESSWSNYGKCVDLYAPGELVKVASTTSIYSTALGSGTSFSAPLVTAGAAQVLHDHPTWTPAQVAADLTARATSGVIGGTRPDSPPPLLLNVTGNLLGTDPTITGPMYVRETLQATLHWTPTPTTATYQWSRNGVEIPDATGADYLTRADDLGQSITVAVTAGLSGYHDISGTSAAVQPGAPPDPGLLMTVTPSRLMDTRIGLGATGPLHNGDVVNLKVGGVAGVMSSASAVLVNITATDVEASGYVSAYASGGAIPESSSANFTAGKTTANLALVPVGSDGDISLTVGIGAGGTVQLVIDVSAYVAGGVATVAGTVVPVTPTRLVDTRESVAVSGGGMLAVNVAGVAGVPADAAAVFVNVTVTQPGAGGFLTVFPAEEAVPTTSNLNFVQDQTVPNLVLAKVGSSGSIWIKNAGKATVQVVVDLQGYITAGPATEQGAVVPVSPVRIVDSRIGLGVSGPVAASTGAVVTVTGGVVPTGVQGVFMNLTVTETHAPGWLAAYATQATRPLVSNLNFEAGQTVPNLATVGLSDGLATVYNGSLNRGTVQMVIDVFAYIL